MNRIQMASAIVPILLSTAAFGASDPKDAAMLGLASKSGCLTCHSVAVSGATPIGPAWAEVADKYRGQKDAIDKLTATVEQGSNPYESHWKGKSTGLAMPPNAVAITEPEARKLVTWIVGLPPEAKKP